MGGATAGHTAVRVGDAVFHYQHDGDVFRLMRQGWEGFRLEYAGFQNRPIHAVALRIPASDATRLREVLTTAHLDALHALGRRERARRAHGLLEDWSADAHTTLIDGAFAFAATGRLSEDALGPALATQLASRRDTRLDTQLDLAGLRARAEEDRARALAGVAEGTVEPGRAAARIGFAHALRLIEESRPLRPEALVTTASTLTDAERRSLEALSEGLVERIGELAASGGAHHAEALLVGIARHRTLQASLRSGRLQLLDRGVALHAVAREASHGSGPEEREAARAFAEGLFAEARARLLDGDAPHELEWSRLEELAARSAPRSGPIRIARAGRAGAVAVSWPEPGAAVGAARSRAEARARQVEADVARRFAYDLIERNCVTELLLTIQSGLGGTERADALLGAPLRIARPLGYAPWVFHSAARRLPGARLERTASYREEALEAESRTSGWLPTRLRESNVVTSSLYAARDADGSFLLFTSQARGAGRLLLPLLGAANLTVGLGDSLVGALAAPFDGGHRLRRGLRGVLFSLPELAFVNVRKGSFDTRRLDPSRDPFATLPPGAVASDPEGGPRAL